MGLEKKPKLVLNDDQYRWLLHWQQEIVPAVESGDRKWIGRFKKTVGYRVQFGTLPFNRVWRAFQKRQQANPLRHLWNVTEAFFQRFDCYPPDTEAQYRAFDEEVGEFQEEIVPYRRKTFDPQKAAEEANDVLVTMMGCLMARGVTYDQFEAALFGVADKLDAKNITTHYVDKATGKITRKQF